ncbi:hypothetical protein MGU_10158 [Metarhizium guizhouense ARSEF 977]|uniref:Uncharacterized protein n=1 Tax=Metarhizium guizhouense (strain ARSEF 977) TaxID=1276136 RepID=A0A0B4GRW8_METGA|nr:hypothetical protein MGU_10158 [Metarhizium guizhouense ARSEF 977]
MIVSKLSLVSSVLVSGIAAVPIELASDDVLVGYRTVAKASRTMDDAPLDTALFRHVTDNAPKEQARLYNDAKTLIADERNGVLADQIGKGVYTSPGRGEWQDHGLSEPWYCAVWAKLSALESVSKVWVPSGEWWEGESSVAEFVTRQGLDPDKTLRMSLIWNKRNLQQTLIPKGLLNDRGGNMGFKVWCESDQEKLPNTRVDYEDKSWKKNAKGKVQRPKENPEEPMGPASDEESADESPKKRPQGDRKKPAKRPSSPSDSSSEYELPQPPKRPRPEGEESAEAAEGGGVEGTAEGTAEGAVGGAAENEFAAADLFGDGDLLAGLKANEVAEGRFLFAGVEEELAGESTVFGLEGIESTEAIDALYSQAETEALEAQSALEAEEASALAAAAEGGSTFGEIFGEALELFLER